MFRPRLADEGLHVDEARRDDVAGAVDDARAFGSVALSNGFAELGDDAVERHETAAHFDDPSPDRSAVR